MFLFKCCQEFKSGVGYEVHKANSTDFTCDLKQINSKELTTQRVSVFKIKKSEFEEVREEFIKNKKKFIDPQFPAQERSLGEIEGIYGCSWKRISELITNPILIGDKIQPSQVIQGALGDCYFLSALAALAENPYSIRNMFEGQSYNPSGIYKVTMKLNGQLQEVVVDDFIPVNANGQPLFCQPYHNQFWVLILQKAWAKAHRSYANIILGTPTAVFKSLALAPADLLQVKDKNQQKQKLWNFIIDSMQAGYPMVCCAKEESEKGSWIEGGHSYSLINAAVLEDTEGTYHKVVKLRDPWGKELWEGSSSSANRAFWSKIVGSQQRKQFERKPTGGDLGVFYLPFNQFCTYFSQIHYCLLSKQPNYNSEPLFVNKKNGSLFEVEVLKKGIYSFEIHQSQILEFMEEDKSEETICRATLLLFKKTSEGPHFVNGILKYNQEDSILTETIEAGSYLLFAKIDPTRNKAMVPSKTVVSVYSPCFTTLEIVEQIKYPDLFRRAFLNQARGFKKNIYNNGLMWVSWKLLLQQGGYAYIAMGVDPLSNKKFVIDFNEQEFNKMNFHLKGEFKGKGIQRIEVLPGQEQIILARVDNKLIKSLKFPPTLGIKMELVPGK